MKDKIEIPESLGLTGVVEYYIKNFVEFYTRVNFKSDEFVKH